MHSKHIEMLSSYLEIPSSHLKVDSSHPEMDFCNLERILDSWSWTLVTLKGCCGWTLGIPKSTSRRIESISSWLEFMYSRHDDMVV